MKFRRNHLRGSRTPKIKIRDSDSEILIRPAWKFMQLGLVLANKQDLAELLGCVRTRVRAARLNGEDFARALVAHLGSVSVARL